MRVHGWCAKCHRVRLVKVGPSGWTRNAVVIGTCRECEDKEEQRRNERRRPR